MIDIKGLDKAKVLKALYDNTRPQGIGFLNAKQEDMNLENVSEMLMSESWVGRPLSFDYIAGRPLKVDITGDEFDEFLYDRDAGAGTAARAIDELRNSK